MKRRHFVQSLLALTASQTLIAKSFASVLNFDQIKNKIKEFKENQFGLDIDFQTGADRNEVITQRLRTKRVIFLR